MKSGFKTNWSLLKSQLPRKIRKCTEMYVPIYFRYTDVYGTYLHNIRNLYTYRITGCFCGCKCLRFGSENWYSNFCEFNFCCFANNTTGIFCYRCPILRWITVYFPSSYYIKQESVISSFSFTLVFIISLIFYNCVTVTYLVWRRTFWQGPICLRQALSNKVFQKSH